MEGLLNPRCFAHHTLSLFLAGLMLVGPRGILLADEGAPHKDQSAADVAAMAGLLPTAAVVLVVRPAQILQSPLAEAFPYEIVQAASLKELGLDPLKMESLIIAGSPPENGRPSYAARATFGQPAHLKSGKATEHTQPGTLNGKEYLQSQDMMAPSFYMPAENTLVAAPDFTLRSLYEKADGGADPDDEAAMSPFLAACQAAVHNDDIYLAADMAAVRPFILMGLTFANDIPPELAPLKEIPGLVRNLEFRLNFTQDRPTELIITADDDKAAGKIVTLVETVKQRAAAKATEGAEQLLASSDPVEQATGRYQQRMSSHWQEQLQLERSGDEIVIFRTYASDPQARTMLVSTFVIGVLVALLLPALQSAREAARRSASRNNVRQIEIGLHLYESDHGRLPAYASFDKEGKPLLSWRVHLLPFLEEKDLYDEFHLDEPWDSPHNKKLIPRMPALYRNPSSGLPPDEGRTGYLGVLGKGCAFTGEKEGLTFRHVSDGLSSTANLVQVSDDAAEVWTCPADWRMAPDNPKDGLGGLHIGGWVVGFMDGSCRFIRDDVNDLAWKAALTTSGGESIPLGD